MRSSYIKIITSVTLAILLFSLAPSAQALDESAGLNTSQTVQQIVNTPNPSANESAGLNTSQTVQQIAGNTNQLLTGSQVSCDTLTRCIAVVVYWIGPGISSWVAWIGAAFFSMVIQFSLNSGAYALDFLSQGWTVTRDLANMAFIFILIYLGVTIMLRAEQTGTIKLLVMIIVMAMLVNFSFFFTRVVIDAGNILAVQFYNAIPAAHYADGSVATIGNAKDLSATIMNALGVQTLLNSSSFGQAQNFTGQDPTSWGGLIVYTVIYLFVAAALWMLTFSFIAVGIKFLMRIVGLWLVLVASPLAFVANAIPGNSKKWFSRWLEYLVKFSMYPAIFLFMFLLLNKFVSALLSTSGVGGGAAAAPRWRP